MKTWADYKEHVKSVDNQRKEDLEEIEELAKIISVMIQQRNSLGLSQRELASLCGIPQSSVARIESHATIPRLDTLLKIFAQLGLKLSAVPIINSK